MKRSMLVATAAVAALATAGTLSAGAFLATPRPAMAKTAQVDACAALTGATLTNGGKIASAVSVAADAAKGTPAYCEATGTLAPVAGSTIGVVFRLPAAWNGKMLGIGGGGWAGNLRLEAAMEGLNHGYATAQTDGGHGSVSPWDTTWASNPESITDFSYRAVHLTSVVGKEVVAAYYGKPQQKAYFQGCSTGGRMGLMEVQRFPDDYDAVISGAPVYNLLVQTSAVVRNNIFAQAGQGFTPAQLSLVNQAVLKSCDAKDGLEDGLIADPRACAWDPAEIRCKAGAAPGDQCLGEGQVAALRQLYGGVNLISGPVAAWPLAKGGEPGWSMFIQTSGAGKDATNGGGLGGLRGPILGDPDFDMAKFNPDTDIARVRTSAFAHGYEANDPAIGAFLAHGGKLLIWHGWSDPGPSPYGTISYYKQVAGSEPKAADGVRLFMAPGVYHCGGGPGPDQIDTLTALDQWVKTGVAPESLLATKKNAKISRPLCAFPKKAAYKGSGDPDDAANFTCG